MNPQIGQQCVSGCVSKTSKATAEEQIEEEDDKKSIIVPVEIRYEDAWAVEEKGTRMISEYGSDEVKYVENGMPWANKLEANGKTGKVTIVQHVEYKVDNNVESDHIWWSGGNISYDMSMKRDATFHYMTLWKSIQYHYSEDENGNLPQEVVGMQSGGGHGVGQKSVELAEMPQMYCIRVFWDGKIVEELITK